jgi:heptosyltransferase-2
MMNSKRLLVWLPSPLGDAVMATPALRMFRSLFQDAKITCFGPAFTQQILSPSPFCDNWLVLEKSIFGNFRTIRAGGFDTCVLLKNSFSSAFVTRCCGITRRVGYARDGRSFLLTDKISPLRMENGQYQPTPMIDYYLNIAKYLGGAVTTKKPELYTTPEDIETVSNKFENLKAQTGPLVILVPGGAFGPSKLWPIERYAKLADRLAETYKAKVILSVAPVQEEIEISKSICKLTTSNPINLGHTSLNGGQLKALYSLANLVITNDTGPRHIAIALDRPVVSLFGPNNSQWTQTGHDKEVQIFGKAPCVPCDKPECKQNQHLCMESISVNEVFEAAADFLKI